jgi:hypothetical protein
MTIRFEINKLLQSTCRLSGLSIHYHWPILSCMLIMINDFRTDGYLQDALSLVYGLSTASRNRKGGALPLPLKRHDKSSFSG